MIPTQRLVFVRVVHAGVRDPSGSRRTVELEEIGASYRGTSDHRPSRRLVSGTYKVLVEQHVLDEPVRGRDHGAMTCGLSSISSVTTLFSGDIVRRNVDAVRVSLLQVDRPSVAVTAGSTMARPRSAPRSSPLVVAVEYIDASANSGGSGRADRELSRCSPIRVAAMCTALIGELHGVSEQVAACSRHARYDGDRRRTSSATVELVFGRP